MIVSKLLPNEEPSNLRTESLKGCEGSLSQNKLFLEKIASGEGEGEEEENCAVFFFFFANEEAVSAMEEGQKNGENLGLCEKWS